jgi:hypothetical protein
VDLSKLRKLVAIDPADPLSRFALGKKLLEQDPSIDAATEAVEHLRFANEKSPNHLATYVALADGLIRVQQFAEAKHVLEAGLPHADAVGEGMGRDLAPLMRRMLEDLP